jgi:hypothetical protein
MVVPPPEGTTIALISPCRAVKDTPERASMSFLVVGEGYVRESYVIIARALGLRGTGKLRFRENLVHSLNAA